MKLTDRVISEKIEAFSLRMSQPMIRITNVAVLLTRATVVNSNVLIDTNVMKMLAFCCDTRKSS